MKIIPCLRVCCLFPSHPVCMCYDGDSLRESHGLPWQYLWGSRSIVDIV